jgi:hypothetical protein
MVDVIKLCNKELGIKVDTEMDNMKMDFINKQSNHNIILRLIVGGRSQKHTT